MTLTITTNLVPKAIMRSPMGADIPVFGSAIIHARAGQGWELLSLECREDQKELFTTLIDIPKAPATKKTSKKKHG